MTPMARTTPCYCVTVPQSHQTRSSTMFPNLCVLPSDIAVGCTHPVPWYCLHKWPRLYPVINSSLARFGKLPPLSVCRAADQLKILSRHCCSVWNLSTPLHSHPSSAKIENPTHSPIPKTPCLQQPSLAHPKSVPERLFQATQAPPQASTAYCPSP